LKLQTGKSIYSALYPQIPRGKMLTRRFWEALSHLTEALIYKKNLGRILHPGHAPCKDSPKYRKAQPLAKATERCAT